MLQKQTKKESLAKAKGMRDILSEEYNVRQQFIEKAENIASFYGFKPIQTPILEKAELFSSAIGENTDMVEKEMYNLKTKGGDRLVLRPEGTAPAMRAYIEHGMHTKPQPVMLFYHGSFFRHEKPQRGRYREFQQFGLEILGEPDSIADAIIIKTTMTILEEAAKIKPLILRINSIGDEECRKIYQKELITFYRKRTGNLCKDCLQRLKTNPLRLLDCKNPKCEEIRQDAPQPINFLCENCKNHFKNLLEILDASDISYYLDHYLVRGLDYYSRTTFEFFPAPNKQKENEPEPEKPEDKNEEEQSKPLALAGGGRYDMLSKNLSGKNVPATGSAIGIDRIIEIMKQEQKISFIRKPTKVFFIQLGIGAKQKSLIILEMLRKAKIPVKHSLSKDSLKSQLKIAAKLKIPFVMILGQKEVIENNVIVKNMETTSQETVSMEKLLDFLKKKI